MDKPIASEPVINPSKGGRRNDALDGFRAFAVLTVFAFHLFANPRVSWNPLRPAGGFLSLDVFYVLSGYLITSLLLAELDKRGRISLRSFYARRALRLFPALGVLLVVVLVAALVERNQYWSHLTLVGLPWVLLYAGNWYVVFYGAFAPLGAIGQTWSLGVEEQFYVLWPILLIFVTRRFANRARIAGILLGVAGAVMIYRFGAIEFLGWVARDRIYFGSDTHCDGLIVGCALAFYLSSRPSQAPFSERAHRVIAVGAVIGTVGLIAMIMGLNYVKPFSVWFGISAAGLCTAAMVLNLVTRPLPGLSHILSLRPIVWIGKRSYGMYLWQSTVTVLFNGMAGLGLGRGSAGLVEILVTFVIAGVSYRFVEMPFLRRKRAFSRTKPVVLPVGGALPQSN